MANSMSQLGGRPGSSSGNMSGVFFYHGDLFEAFDFEIVNGGVG
jgi:hypothetical protein